MNTDLRRITSFVHDIKTPLAVIELAARTLLKIAEGGGEGQNSETECCGVILDHKDRAINLLNRLLESARRQGQRGPFKRGVYFFRKIARKFLLPAEKSPPDDAVWFYRTLNSLSAMLMMIEGRIHHLESQSAVAISDSRERGNVIGRMQRNIHKALALCARAEALIMRTNEKNTPESHRLCDVINAALIDVLDLMDGHASEKLQAAHRLVEVKKVIADQQIFLEVEENLWETTYLLDLELVGQVITNLLMNAIRFRRTAANLYIEQKQSGLVVTVSDDGGPFPLELIQSIRKRGVVQPQPASNSHLKVLSHGLGLFGAGAILRTMGGHMEINRPGDPKFISAVLQCFPLSRNATGSSGALPD